MALAEFELIDRYFSPLIAAQNRGDDCAFLTVEPGCELAISTDTLVEGIHFPVGADAEALAWRALGCCGSDLAAVGAQPLGFTLALTLPAVEDCWLEAFSRGLKAAVQALGMPLLGGDTTRGPLSLTLSVLGTVPAHHALRRSGGQVGDQVWVSGHLGGAAAALDFIEQPTGAEALLACYWRPRPRLDLGLALRGIAHAAIDISDGLLADLGHLCAASECGAVLDAAQIPAHPQAEALLGRTRAQELALIGGDDYELCFTAPTTAAPTVTAVSEQLGLSLHCIGELVAEPGLRWRNGDEIGPLSRRAGYQHFGSESC